MLHVYRPNHDDPNFFVNLFFNITYNTELIIGGDFNLALDPAKDRSSPTSKSLSSAVKALKKELEDLNLINVWRVRHTSLCEYKYSIYTYITGGASHYLMRIFSQNTLKSCSSPAPRDQTEPKPKTQVENAGTQVCQYITYLGLKVPTQLDRIFSLNYEALFNKVEKDLDRWMQLPISLIGRMNCIKMNVLPRFLYLFQTLPISIPNKFFKKLESVITRFIWRGKVPRIKIKTLYNTPQYGGSKLPNFELFYWAPQLRAIWFWQTEMNNPSGLEKLLHIWPLKRLCSTMFKKPHLFDKCWSGFKGYLENIARSAGSFDEKTVLHC
uniref:Endonuclease/exonuclease/phosphatase domain-containing protein n=1 Tax=Dicentrarchus labrax TaxID=13489 RepID=A0A8P4JZV7_DICLA